MPPAAPPAHHQRQTPIKQPAFFFYAKDWISGTLSMSLEEKGAYIALLAYAWDHHGRIPAESEKLARILSVSRTKARTIFARIRNKFRLSRSGDYTNPKLARVKRDHDKFLTIRRKGGKVRAATAHRHGGKFAPAAAGSLLVADDQQNTSLPNALALPSTKVQRRNGAASSSACAKPVNKSSAWRRGVAIAHVVIESKPRDEWTSEFKARAREQRLPYDQPGGRDGRPLYARVLDYVEQARSKRQ